MVRQSPSTLPFLPLPVLPLPVRPLAPALALALALALVLGAAEPASGFQGAEPPPAVTVPESVQPAEKDCVARTIYFEARGEPEQAQAAVAAVVLNRAEHPDFPDTPCDVVEQGGEKGPCQFSWFCDGRSDRAEDRAAWRTAREITEALVEGRRPDPTGGALYFHHSDVEPDWARVFQPTAALGAHVFYRPPPTEE